ncbi:MAG TPA: glycogen debranching N-terminal domain-containing protein [Acidimicrobiales bacterium]|nr:glycogen debranching N-terminal domain-containing protein [Acidimicrobiales bacterium]
MGEPWTFTGEPPSVGQTGTVTLVEGATFCISGRGGDIAEGESQGLFFRDTRFLSSYELRLNGLALQTLSSFVGDPFTATFVTRARPRPGRADSTLVAFRNRYVGRGMREDIVIRNFGDEPVPCTVELAVDVDFADLFEVKEGRVELRGERSLETSDGRLSFGYHHDGARRGTVVSSHGLAVVEHHLLCAEVVIEPQGAWTGCVELAPVIDDVRLEPLYRCGRPVARAAPTERLQRWRRQVPTVSSSHAGLEALVARSQADLGALRIFDPDFPERAVVAAGAPWFMTLFGRDSLLTSWMTMLIDPDLALGVVQTLARFQGEKVDKDTEEEPGRILHEMRFGSTASLSLSGGHVYYGTADATPLFVMLLGELRRWGLAAEQVDRLLPHVDRAMAWIADYGDRDGDGFVEYEQSSPRGLRNQGWKDSWDGVRDAAGTLAQGPVALCEVQGYTYAAYVARAHFAHEAGDEATATVYRAKAADLKVAFNRDFWLDDRQWFAMALDGDNRPLDALTSNMGHCLWTGIVDEDKAAAVAGHLLSPAMFSGWGVRTLATTMVGYNPISYHNGSVWPHDSAIVAAGLMRYGFVEEAQRISMGLIDTAAAVGGRLPELFGGLDRSELPGPLGYPASCSPQAWAAAAPLLLLRHLLRFDPWLPHGKLWLDPVVPRAIGRLRVGHIPLGGGRLAVEVDGADVSVEGLPPGVELVREARQPLSAEASEKD